MTPDCLDCRTSSRGICPLHADSDSVDIEITKLKEENARLSEMVHKSDGMANEVNILVRENRSIRATVESLKEALEELVRIGNRKTVEWDRARAALAKAREGA